MQKIKKSQFINLLQNLNLYWDHFRRLMSQKPRKILFHKKTRWVNFKPLCCYNCALKIRFMISKFCAVGFHFGRFWIFLAEILRARFFPNFWLCQFFSRRHHTLYAKNSKISTNGPKGKLWKNIKAVKLTDR